MLWVRSIGALAPSITPAESEEGQQLKDFLPVFKTSTFLYTRVYHTLQRGFVFFFLLQRSFTPLTRSRAYGDPGEGGCSGGDSGCCGSPAVQLCFGGLWAAGLSLCFAGPTLPVAPHQGVSAGLRRLAEGCRDAQSSVSPGGPCGATDAHSSWPGFGGCCTPTQELLLVGCS